LSDQDVEAFLEHVGVKGMKWGVRGAQRAQNRALNKASRAKDKATPPQFTPSKKPLTKFSSEYKRDIDKARANIRSGKTAYEYKSAKFQYKKDKVELGSREAKKTLRKARAKKYAEIETSRQVRDGGEMVMKLLSDVSRQMQSNANARARF